MRGGYDYEESYEDTAPEEVAPTALATPSDDQILAFVQANIDNPALIAETAAQYGVSVADLSRVTGYGEDAVVSYFQQADVAPPAYTPPPTGGLNAVAETTTPPPPPPERVEEPPPRPEIYEPPPDPEEPIYEPPRPPEKPVYEPPRPPVIVERPEPPPPPVDVRPPPPPPIREIEERPPEKPVVEPPRPPKEIVERPEPPPPPPPVEIKPPPIEEKPVVEPPSTPPPSVEKPVVLPTVTDYQGNQYDGAQLLTLAQQIAQNAGSMTGGAFQTKGQNIGFAASEANTLLGRTATASEQVLLDMARQLIQTGVTDLSQLKTQDITSSGVSVQIDPETNQYYALIPSGDGETSTRKELTPDQVAKIKTEEIYLGGDNGTQIQRTIDDLVTGKGLFANGKLLTQQDAVDNPIAYTIGATYTGGGGTSYDLKFDPKTGKSVVSANGFTTSDADSIMPIIMVASNFLLPGVGSMLASTLAEAGMSEIVSQVVSKAVINGVTSGIMAEASGGQFGDGFLKGAVTGAISAGVAPMISTALPSDLSPAMSTALTKAGTAAITALATGKDVGTAVGTQLLNSVVGTGLSSVTGEMGLSTADAKLLNSVLTPVITQLVTNGNVNDATIMNAVLLAGSTVLANTGSITNTTDVTTGDDTSGGGLNLLARDAASTLGTGLATASTVNGLVSKATSLTQPVTKVNKTKASLVGALTTTGKPTTKEAAVKPAALSTLNAAKTTSSAVKPAALGALNTAKKTLTAQQISQLKANKPAAQVNVANLTPIKKATPPQKVDVKTLIPVKTAQLPAGLNTKKMG